MGVIVSWTNTEAADDVNNTWVDDVDAEIGVGVNPVGVPTGVWALESSVDGDSLFLLETGDFLTYEGA